MKSFVSVVTSFKLVAVVIMALMEAADCAAVGKQTSQNEKEQTYRQRLRDYTKLADRINSSVYDKNVRPNLRGNLYVLPFSILGPLVS